MADAELRERSKRTLDDDGVLVLYGFLRLRAIRAITDEEVANAHLAYFTENTHNAYLEPPDLAFATDHPRNRLVQSSKGCTTTDQVPESSALKQLYDAQDFRAFLCALLVVDALFEYADPLSSINIHCTGAAQELGWHFDNSSFAITLLLWAPQAGGVFQYVNGVRDAEAGERNFTFVSDVLDGTTAPCEFSMQSGTLVLFRGRNAMHRVTPTPGPWQRLLAVLAYNTRPDVALSESAQQTFFGRIE